jgi:hypothetical protein
MELVARAPLAAAGLRLERAIGMITVPFFYLAFFGGGQLLWLWTQWPHFGLVVPAVATVGFGGLLVWLRLPGSSRARYLALLALAGVMLIGPMIGAIATRSHIGLTFEYDGLAKAEVAVDRLLHGRQIYDVSWAGTQVDGYGYIFNGLEVRHFNHLPLTVLAAVPVWFLSAATGIPFDYRMVLIAFATLGLTAVTAIRLPDDRRFMLVCAVFLNPALATITVTGHDDITYAVMLLAMLALLTHRRIVLACLALGIGIALKPFAALALPLLAIVLWRLRTFESLPRSRAEADVSPSPARRAQARISPSPAHGGGSGWGPVFLCLVAVAAPSVLTIVPFLLWNAGAFFHEIVLFTNGGGADAYPISGFGFGALLVAFGLLRPQDYFPFGLLQAAVLAPMLLLGWRVLARRPTLGAFWALFTGMFFLFSFFARFFAHNYVAVLVAAAFCIAPLGDAPIMPLPETQVGAGLSRSQSSRA